MLDRLLLSTWYTTIQLKNGTPAVLNESKIKA